MSWLEKLLPPKIQQTDPADRRSVPEGLWIKCPSCETVLYKADLEQNQNVCPTCSHHHRIGARARLNLFLDNEGRFEIGQEVLPVDALKFKDSRKYTERLKEALENTGETDALNDAHDIRERFEHHIAAVIDAGACTLEPTTVVDLTEGEPRLVRAGRGPLAALGL